MYPFLIQNLFLEYPLFTWHSVWVWTWTANKHLPSRCLAWMTTCQDLCQRELTVLCGRVLKWPSVEVPEFALTFDKECGC